MKMADSHIGSKPLDLNCIGLYKAALLNNMLVPEPNVHVYLAGVALKAQKPVYLEATSAFLAHAPEDLDAIVMRFKSQAPYRYIPYLVGRTSGDFLLDLGAELKSRTLSTKTESAVIQPEFLVGDPEFAAACYSVAHLFGEKMGRTAEAEVFVLLAQDLEQYVGLLATYYWHLREDSEFEITEEDYQSLKEHVRNRCGKRILIEFPYPEIEH